MHRRQFLQSAATIAAGTVAFTHEAAASVVDAFGEKTRPVDTKNVVKGWGTGAAKPLTIKGRTLSLIHI